MNITMDQFIGWYWGKLQRNGTDWTVGEIVEDCGAPNNLILLLETWCEQYGKGLTDAELSAKFNNNYFINDTAFGPIISAKLGPSANTLTLADLVADLKAVLGKYIL